VVRAAGTALVAVAAGIIDKIYEHRFSERMNSTT
jgi:hypothetical protein